jgi:hypothetical protein
MKRTGEERLLLCAILIYAIVAGVMVSVEVLAADARFCGVVYRNATTHEIIRSAAVKAAFKREHPCPSTGLTSGACPGWSVDHVLPLANGFCDSVENLQWLPNVLKSGTGIYPKDRWERKINGRPQILVPMPPTGILTVP